MKQRKAAKQWFFHRCMVKNGKPNKFGLTNHGTRGDAAARRLGLSHRIG